MIVYSKQIMRFIREIKEILKYVLSREVGLKVTDNYFYDKRGKIAYPLNIVIYNHKSMVGYFDPSFHELGFHECLMHSSKEQLQNIIRHELAHYITFINHGPLAQPHSTEFRTFCERMGWGEKVYRATICLEGGLDTNAGEEEGVLRKVQKLMALSTSSNKNEAEQALLKSQQLLLKHCLDATYIRSAEEEKVVLKRIMQQKKEDAKMRSIAKILETFFVNIVYRRAEGFICLEILGSAVNVEIAEYVAQVLQSELEVLWSQAQEQSGLRGITAKNSFFLGLARGYRTKIEALKKGYNTATTQALLVIEKKLTEVADMVYPRLRRSKRRANHCPASALLGEQMGKQLNINPAINKAPSPSDALLTRQY